MHSFNELVAKFEKRFSETLPFPNTVDTLYDPCRYFSLLGGKRVRPVLCLMANELFHDINEDAWHGAFAIELFHNFTLVHDDIMDKAPLRRGKQTLHTRYGLTSGILCGDVMNIFAYKSLSAVRTALPQVLDVFNRTAIEVCEGQQLDMDFETRNDVTLAEYLHMITLKTSVLLACSLKIGALTAGGLEDNAAKLYEFGKNLGIAFQLQDDYLDAFGDPEKSGKQQGGDILANKKTFLLVNALQQANAAETKEIMNLLSDASATKVQDMLNIFSATKADVACRQAVADYSDKAFDSLDKVAIPAARKQELQKLAAMLLERER
jgi:geranylgeranyl diphosphate synthase, type II